MSIKNKLIRYLKSLPPWGQCIAGIIMIPFIIVAFPFCLLVAVGLNVTEMITELNDSRD